MTIFDLIFIAVFFTTAIMLVVAVVAAIAGRHRRAIGTLRALGVLLAAYLVTVIAASLTTPQRLIHMREAQCFDDWCIAVDRAEGSPEGENVLYAVTLRVFSRARRATQRENGVTVYVLDDRGRHYTPRDDPRAAPFNVRLGPGESVTTTRSFVLPADAEHPGLIVAHSRFPGMFIIGDNESLLHKPSVVRFP